MNEGVQILHNACRAPITEVPERHSKYLHCLFPLRLFLYASMPASPSPTNFHNRSMYIMGISHSQMPKLKDSTFVKQYNSHSHPPESSSSTR